jgi:hypothetical protein
MNPIFESIEPCDLDDIVRDAKSDEASGINNGGLEEQIPYLTAYYGSEGKLIEVLQELEILPEWQGK